MSYTISRIVYYNRAKYLWKLLVQRTLQYKVFNIKHGLIINKMRHINDPHFFKTAKTLLAKRALVMHLYNLKNIN